MSCGTDERGKLLGVLVGDGRVDLTLARTKLATVTWLAVEEVVEALGDGEELGRALDRHPAHVEPGTARVGREGAQHLRDATALRRRVHVPDGTPFEQAPGTLEVLLELAPRLRIEKLLEPCGRKRGSLDLVRVKRHDIRSTGSSESSGAGRGTIRTGLGALRISLDETLPTKTWFRGP